MMTIDEVRAELAHLREVPARLRLERLMRESGGLVDMLEGMLEHACSIQEASPAVGSLALLAVGNNGDVLSIGGEWKASEPEPIKRKRGRPARRVSDAGEA